MEFLYVLPSPLPSLTSGLGRHRELTLHLVYRLLLLQFSPGKTEAEHTSHVTIYERREVMHMRDTIPFQQVEMFVEFEHGDPADPFISGDNFPKLFNNTRGVLKQTRLSSRPTSSGHQYSPLGSSVKSPPLPLGSHRGCQATAPIDYSTVDESHQLAGFFLRLDRMADVPEARGYDTSVRGATAKEVNNFAEAVKAASEGHFGPEGMRARGQKQGARCMTMDRLRRARILVFHPPPRGYSLGHPQ